MRIPNPMQCLAVRRQFFIVGALALMVLGIACGSETPTSTTVVPTSTPAVSHNDDPEAMIAAGMQLYLIKGCSSCHGQDAEGTAIAPALPGHTGQQVMIQVRSPLALMPAFSKLQITDEELSEIAAYVESLSTSAGHVEPIGMEDVVAMHHWMALSALAADNHEEAEHHVVHIIELVQDDAEHLHQMEEVLEALEAGDEHGAEHPIEAMLAGMADPDLTPSDMHLRLTLVGLESGNLEDIRHHMDHFVEEATDDERISGQEILEMLDAGALDDARHEIEEILGTGGHDHSG